MKYLTRFADKNTALEFTTGGRVLKAPHVSKVGNDAVFSENIERGKSCIFVEESDGELKLVEPPEAYVTFTAQEDNSSIGLTKLSTKQVLEYSTDTTTWNTFDTTTNISLNNGDKVYVRGISNTDVDLGNYNIKNGLSDRSCTENVNDYSNSYKTHRVKRQINFAPIKTNPFEYELNQAKSIIDKHSLLNNKLINNKHEIYFDFPNRK
jgi:hypothetical protein